MIRRTALAAGAVGAVALALTGTGSFASFTSSVSGTNSITSGTFQLQAVPGKTSVSGPLIFDATNGGQPTQTLTAGNEPTTVGQGNTLAYTLGNANPGDTYDYQFSVYDVGTLQGQVDTINYSPAAAGATVSPLLGQMTVEVQEQVNGTWTDIPQKSIAKNGSNAPGTPASASLPHTYYLFYSYGPQFLQPNPTMAAPGANGAPGDEGSATFRVQYVFTNTTSNPNEVGGTVQNQNAVEGLTANPTITVNGTNTP